MAHTNTWDASYEADPADSDPVSEGAAKIRGDKKDTRERIAKDHYMDIGGTDADHGEHKKVTFHAPISTPNNVANKGFVYGKNVGGKIELHFLDEDDNEVQLTSGGIINAAILKALGTTKGDVIVFTGSGAPVRLAVGSNGQIIAAASGEAKGIIWQDPSDLWTYGSQIDLTNSGGDDTSTWELSGAIPAAAVEIKVMLHGFGGSSSSANFKLQLGDAGGLETAGYVSKGMQLNTSSVTMSAEGATDSFLILSSAGYSDDDNGFGSLELIRWDRSEHLWLCRGMIMTNDRQVYHFSGYKTLSARLTTVQFLCSAGNFDAGEARLMYR